MICSSYDPIVAMIYLDHIVDMIIKPRCIKRKKIYNQRKWFFYGWIWCISGGARQGKREACHVGKRWAEVQKFPSWWKGVSLPGTVEIAALSFSETPSTLSLSGNSNNSADPVLQGRRKDFTFYTFYTSGTQSWERLNLHNWFQEVTKVVQRFMGWSTAGAVLKSRVDIAARDSWEEGWNSKKINKENTDKQTLCVILPTQLILS